MQAEPVALAGSKPEDGLVKAIRAALKKTLDLDQVFAHCDERSSGRQVYTFKTPVSPVGTALLPLREIDRFLFWVEARLVLLDVGKLYLRSLSLKVLVGEGTESLRPVCRAEWMFPAPDESGGGEGRLHAQPHWHVYDVTAKPIAFDPAPTGFDAYLASERDQERRSLKAIAIAPFDAERIHFSMAAAWHTRTSAASATISSPREVAAWLSGCAQYIADQLEYAALKSS